MLCYVIETTIITILLFIQWVSTHLLIDGLWWPPHTVWQHPRHHEWCYRFPLSGLSHSALSSHTSRWHLGQGRCYWDRTHTLRTLRCHKIPTVWSCWDENNLKATVPHIYTKDYFEVYICMHSFSFRFVTFQRITGNVTCIWWLV